MHNQFHSIDVIKLVSLIGETQHYFRRQAQKQVNIALTLRNWLFGYYIAEYELNGADRAHYGEGLFKEIARQLAANGVRQIRERHLYLCKDFYTAYPNILLTPSAKFYLKDLPSHSILSELSGASENAGTEKTATVHGSIAAPLQDNPELYVNKLINQLSFSHFIELMKAGTNAKREFYETEAMKNNWSVRELQRAVNSMLYERTGLSRDKQSVLQRHAADAPLLPEDVFRNPYILEFLDLKEEISYTESELEQAILSHLQVFLLELGKGFCFEARQKRITFDNTHYYIDLVFYHRILRCNVLVDLKLGEFTHADAGQMNMYLNYYKENEMHHGDNPPLGIILCAGKNDNLVKYATAGLSQQVFVSKYLINLPDEDTLKKIIEEEQKKIGF